MTDLLWPGEERAGVHLGDLSLVAAMARVEVVWLEALAAVGVAPAEAAQQLTALGLHRRVDGGEVHRDVAAGAEAGGNPVIPLVALLRSRLDEPGASWVHRGLTSQDVLDTALGLGVRDAVAELLHRLRRAAGAAADLAETHRGAPMAGRTLTQHAVPVTFGLVASQWLAGILDAVEDLGRLRFPVQLGGAAGTRAALWELAGPERGQAVVAGVARELDLPQAPPWHVVRSPWTRAGDAVVRATDACGHVAGDVLVLSRPEVAEVREPAPGGSSTMPGKANPVLATLVRRAALTTPSLAAQLHLAAADAHDQRPSGGWHTEGAALRDLLRRALVAVDQTAELLAGLEVDAGQMARRAEDAATRLRAEQQAMAAAARHEPGATYLGQAGELVDSVLDRARGVLGEPS